MVVGISLVETIPYRLEYIFCRFQPFSGHGNDFFHEIIDLKYIFFF